MLIETGLPPVGDTGPRPEHGGGYDPWRGRRDGRASRGRSQRDQAASHGGNGSGSCVPSAERVPGSSVLVHTEAVQRYGLRERSVVVVVDDFRSDGRLVWREAVNERSPDVGQTGMRTCV